jgi:peptidoglycan/xylan/chitin deacetylase (PgdA/CDA1 family)
MNTMSLDQLQHFYYNPHFAIGAHTLTHLALAYHSAAVQKQELHMGKRLLSQALHTSIYLLDSPYCNCNTETVKLACAVGFTAAFATRAQTITTNLDWFSLVSFKVDT